MTRARRVSLALLGVTVQCAGAGPRTDPSELRRVGAAPSPSAAGVEAIASASTGASAPASAPLRPAPSYLEGSAHLEALFRALGPLEDPSSRGVVVHALQFGDSHTASDLGVSVFRRALQARFGDGGRGFVALGKPWRGYWQSGLHEGMSKEFTPVRFDRKVAPSASNGSFGLLGVAIEARAPGAEAWTDVAAPFARAEIGFWTQPRGGSFDVFVDDVKAGRVLTKGAQPGSAFFAIDLTDTPHKVTIRAAGDGPVRVFGMVLERSRGVVVDTLGLDGAQTFTPLQWQEAHFVEQVAHVGPPLVILAYGTNEAVAPKLADADYERGLKQLLARVLRAAPATSCLLLGPPDLARASDDTGAWLTVPRLVEIVAVQRKVAAEAGCAFFDQLQAMGGPGAMSQWASEAAPRAKSDRVHLRASGYTQIATAFAADLLNAYDAWARRGDSGAANGAAP